MEEKWGGREGTRKQDTYSSFTVPRPLYLFTDGTSHSKCLSMRQVERPEDAPFIETQLNCGGRGCLGVKSTWSLSQAYSETIV